MRFILGLSVVLAVGNAARTAETNAYADASEYQTPAAAVPAPAGMPALPAIAPTMSPAGAYSSAPAQPTTMAPAPNMMSGARYTVGTQPGVTYSTNPTTTYMPNSYPATARNGMFPVTSPAYSNPSVPGTVTYGAPAQSYSAMPGQNYYRPAQRRFGLFQRWRQQVAPAYSTSTPAGAPVYGAPTYPASMSPGATYAAPVSTTHGYNSPAYYATTYAMPTMTVLSAPSMTPAATMAGSATPVYVPTMLSVPDGTLVPAPAAVPVEPPFQGATPSQTTPTPPGARQGNGTSPSAPPIPRSNPA